MSGRALNLFEGAPRADALISSCGMYRYYLLREWDPSRMKVCFLMLNPSTADADADDATIRKCVGFARRWGHGGITVVNLFAFRSTDPGALKTAADPVGPHNDLWIDYVAALATRVVAAWGKGGPRQMTLERAAAVLRLLGSRPLECLGTNADGSPRHPLMLAYDTPRVAFTSN